jgi:hypothetical protein
MHCVDSFLLKILPVLEHLSVQKDGKVLLALLQLINQVIDDIDIQDAL